ncbi:MAG TPA: polysaccharide deacetylase family sporulation protein PdaB [Bacillales bacterium]|nr:polysaccharide deacetylase family sporulation protein PdaB [Bacillales bacterium]
MKFFWIVNGKTLKKTLLIIVSAFIAAAIAFMNSSELPAFSTSGGPRAISKVNTEKKQVALTFDIGWGDLRAKPILRVLEKKNVQATFFVSGSWAEHHPKIAKKIVTEENEIGSHGFGHKNYRSMEEAAIRKDILLAREAIKKATGKTTSLLRPPNGNFNEKVLEIAEALNYTVIDSSVNSRDITNPGARTIIRNVVEPASPGDIILMHASDSAKQTDKALPAIIEKLKDEGYSFVTVSKLLTNAETQSELVK